MKIWQGYGSEHSANLVMIGHFKSAADATKAREMIECITERVRSDEDAGAMKVGEPAARYSDAMLDLLGKLNFVSVGPGELEQFVYDVSIDVKGNDLVIRTEELDVAAFLKVLISRGARVEVYSAHDFPGTGHGRG